MGKVENEIKNKITYNNKLLEMVCNQNMTLSKDMMDLKLKTLILNKQIDMLIEEMQELKNKISK